MRVELPPEDGPLRLSLRRGLGVLDELAGDEGRVVVVHAGKSIRYRDMVAVMDSIASDPHYRVSLATK